VRPDHNLACLPTIRARWLGETPARRRTPGTSAGDSPLQRAQIVELACLEPVAKGLHITHWSSEDLARQAIVDGIVETISPSMVRRILQQVNLQPHRTRYWRTARLDDRFKERAEKVLWCYGNAERLARKGIWVVCTDEVPNLQVLERKPLRQAIPDHIEQQEFEYTRHGTVPATRIVQKSELAFVRVCGQDIDAAVDRRTGTSRWHSIEIMSACRTDARRITPCSSEEPKNARTLFTAKTR